MPRSAPLLYWSIWRQSICSVGKHSRTITLLNTAQVLSVLTLVKAIKSLLVKFLAVGISHSKSLLQNCSSLKLFSWSVQFCSKETDWIKKQWNHYWWSKMKECPGPLKIMSAKKLTSLYIWQPEFSLTPVQKQDIHKNICRLTMYSTDQYVLVTWLWSINIHHIGSVTIPILLKVHSILSNYIYMFSPWLLIVQSFSLKIIFQI